MDGLPPFNDYLRHLLDHSKVLPREIQLGRESCIWLNGVHEWADAAEGFRELTSDEMKMLECRLQVDAHDHVEILNLSGQGMGAVVMQEMAVSISKLDGLQVLDVSGTIYPLFLSLKLHMNFCTPESVVLSYTFLYPFSGTDSLSSSPAHTCHHLQGISSQLLVSPRCWGLCPTSCTCKF
jgi:hypothetical protein